MAAREFSLKLAEINGVTRSTASAVIAEGAPGRTPTIFVHGILDNVWRWITIRDANQYRLRLCDRRMAPTPFDLENCHLGSLGTFPRHAKGPGLLARFAFEGMPAVAYSYQGLRAPVANRNDAIASLHRVVQWALDHWSATRVNLVGHSRGGLICKGALLQDSACMKAADFRPLVESLTTICTPNAGSRLAQAVLPLVDTIARVQQFTQLFARSTNDARPRPAILRWFEDFILNIGQLTPTALEVVDCSCEKLPGLPGGYFAIAGSQPTFYRCELPLVGRVRLPPQLPLEELTDGMGDLAVSVTSALDLPGSSFERTFVAPVNHLSATLDRRVQEKVIEWLKREPPR